MFRISFFNMLSELENYSGSKARCCLSCRLRNHFDDNFPFLCHLKKKKKRKTQTTENSNIKFDLRQDDP